VVGVLALQGDFAAHRLALERQGLATREVRRKEDLDGLAGLVLPGGESTTMLKLLREFSLEGKVRETIAAGLPVLATCAGLILLAEKVENPPQPSLGLLRATVLRNAYGRQVASTVALLQVTDAQQLGTSQLEGVFIRAPRVLQVGEGVQVLARRGEDPVLLRQDSILAATFHPELSAASPVLQLFARLVRRNA
jgi:5'-phosphate synthase pdxT subunit